jgi:hypothetical protein
VVYRYPPGGERSRRRRPPSSGSRVQAIPLTKKKRKKKGKKAQVQARRARRRARRTSRAPPAGTGGRFGPGGQSPDGKGEACRGPSACHVGRSPPVLPSVTFTAAGGRLPIYHHSIRYPLSIYLPRSISIPGRALARKPGDVPAARAGSLRAPLRVPAAAAHAPPAPYGTGQAVRLARWRPPGRSLALLASRRAAPRSCVQCMAALTVGFVVVAERGRHVRRHGPASYVHRSRGVGLDRSVRACKGRRGWENRL